LASTSSAATVTNGKIVFRRSVIDSGMALVVADADGSNPQPVSGPVDPQGPSWSPDGSMIAYSAPVNGVGQAIWVVNADGTNPHVIADTSAYDLLPRWSPDGASIAFIGDVGTGLPNYEIFIAASDGLSLRQFTNTVANESAPTWSPDSSELAFFRSRSLVVASVSGDGTGTVVKAFSKGTTVTNPDWSPDGSRFVFLKGSTHEDFYDVATMTATGKSLTSLTKDKLPDGDPVWSPDGQLILWSRVINQVGRIWRMNADGTNKMAISAPGVGGDDASVDEAPGVTA
jgi:Tol biopolymer transport system component